MIPIKEKKEFANFLRANPTQSEAIVFDALTERKIKFKFQRVLHGYIPDFYFPKQRKIVELDGKCHDAVKDAKRDADFLRHGITTLRIPSRHVFEALPSVIDRIEKFIKPVSRSDVKRQNKKAALKRRRERAQRLNAYLKSRQ